MIGNIREQLDAVIAVKLSSDARSLVRGGAARCRAGRLRSRVREFPSIRLEHLRSRR